MTSARHASPRHGSRPVTLPEQLSLLSATDTPVQFRLDEPTRRRGLTQIALIRRQLAAQAAAHDEQMAVAAPRRSTSGVVGAAVSVIGSAGETSQTAA